MRKPTAKQWNVLLWMGDYYIATSTMDGNPNLSIA